MSRVQVRVLTFLAIAVLFAPLSPVAAEPVASGVDGPPTGANDVPPGATDRPLDAIGPSTAPMTPSDPLGGIDADRVEFRITVYGNGSARWTFTYTRALETTDERRRFEDFAAEFDENVTEAYRNFKERARSLARTGRNRTGRDMTATDFSREAYLGGDCLAVDRCGTVRMSFTWTNFAREEGNRLVVDDVFAGGMYLLEDQQLVFEHGPDLRFVSAAPETYTATDRALHESESITWNGEKQFPDQRPRVVYAPASQVTPTAVQTPGPSTESPTPGGPVQGNSSTWMLLVGIAVVALGAGLALVWRRDGGLSLGDGSPFGGDEGGVASEPAVADEELLSDEDRVLQLLRENGGRMKQVNIVEETGWSKSKVSMLLSDMEEDDQISKLRVGRENIVSLVGHEPDAAGSPHDE